MKALRILVVEDEPLIGILLAEVLTGLGHNVCAIEATELGAVTAAARHGPDLMIVDSRLAVGNGVSAAGKILLSGFIPHVFVTGDALTDAVLSPRAVAIRKPFRESDLVRAMQLALCPPASEQFLTSQSEE
jgi:CheY-like chemotaxis protein